MVLEKDGNKIYFKRHKENKFLVCFITIISIVIMIILCVLIFSNDNKIEINFGKIYFEIDIGLFNILLKNNFGKIILIICVISYIGVFIIDNLFSGNCDYYINTSTRKIYYLEGKWKLKKEIILEFENIKNIVLIENMIMGEGGKSYSYQIDIYDNELNAYEVYVFVNYDIANNIAKKIGKIIGVEVIDLTHIENYEGFIKRIL